MEFGKSIDLPNNTGSILKYSKIPEKPQEIDDFDENRLTPWEASNSLELT